MSDNLDQLVDDYRPLMRTHRLPALRREIWHVRVTPGLDAAAARERLAEFGAVCGWAAFAGASPGIQALRPGLDLGRFHTSWVTAAEAVDAAGRSFAVRPGESGLDLVEVAADSAALPKAEPIEVIVQHARFVPIDGWPMQLRYAIGWRERFLSAGCGHMAPAIARLLGRSGKGREA